MVTYEIRLSPMKNLTQNIRKIRELKGYSQQYVAIALNISQRQYSRLENNGVDIKISILKKIATILEVPVVKLFAFDENLLFRENTPTANGQYSLSEIIKAQYESQIVHLKEEVAFLRKQLEKKV